LTFNLSTRGVVSSLSIEGELDAISVPYLRPTIDKISGEQPTQLLVDLSRLRIIDGSGVGAIVSLFKTVRSYDGKMAVLGAKGQPLAVMRVLHLDRVLMRKAAHLTTGTP
jgi:anti-anti-sigma factor